MKITRLSDTCYVSEEGDVKYAIVKPVDSDSWIVLDKAGKVLAANDDFIFCLKDVLGRYEPQKVAPWSAQLRSGMRRAPDSGRSSTVPPFFDGPRLK